MDPAVDPPFLLAHEPAIRLVAFLGVFAAMAAAEARWPRRRRSWPRAARWPANIGIVVIDTLLLRLLLPAAAVGTAVLVAARGWGLLPALGLGGWPAAVAGFLALDLAIYLQHRAFHAVPLLWRLHRMHHADLDFDVTTAVRFHPLEILLSMAIKMAVVATVGVPVGAVVAFEVVLAATALFNHANLRLPDAVDAALRRVVVTPDMHRVHHSVRREETDSNFGFNLPWWDRLLGTYRARPADGHGGMTIGLPAFRDRRELGLGRLLTQPFRSPGAE
jgi:sterol desaturase/sphingolipid hydroxylase (fatty acid hydroxylase superfamily)